MEDRTSNTEETAREELIKKLQSGAIEYSFGNLVINFQILPKDVNSKGTRESGLLEMYDKGKVVEHVKYTVSAENKVTMIDNKGYGKYEYDENDIDDSDEMRKKYSGHGIMSKATSLLAEYAIYKQTDLLSGLVDPKNTKAIRSRSLMERVVGSGPFKHKWGEGDSAGEFQTVLRT